MFEAPQAGSSSTPPATTTVAPTTTTSSGTTVVFQTKPNSHELVSIIRLRLNHRLHVNTVRALLLKLVPLLFFAPQNHCGCALTDHQTPA